jgi:hypothetical protein
MTEDRNVSENRKAWSAGASFWLAGALAVVLLVATGVVYRVYASELKEALDKPIELPVPLSEIPMKIGDWAAEDLSIPTTTREYMETNFADDFISRRYLNAGENIWADVYVVYCASKPAGILGHQPRVCFPAHGWIWDETSTSEVELRSGRQIKCLIHQFHKPAPAYREVFVLSFWVLNGQITLSEREFSGIFGRRPNISGDPARYVAQVQISSTVEHSARAAAKDIADVVLTFLPTDSESPEPTSLKP